MCTCCTVCTWTITSTGVLFALHVRVGYRFICACSVCVQCNAGMELTMQVCDLWVGVQYVQCVECVQCVQCVQYVCV